MTSVALRLLRAADVPAVLALQAQCYEAQFLESARAFEAKLLAAEPHRSSWIAMQGELAQAYAVALPVCLQTLPALNAPHITPSARPELLYLHDLAVAPAGRSLGLGRLLAEQVEQSARALGLARIGLIAVQDSLAYWQRQGFAELPSLPEGLQAKLASFGPQARWLERQV
ncbi:GNAT family N-acetyltransferase [Pelomonas sp. V22]|uniref:GNAT family N-acetyltransferase n=1 Tax=Pelomonas sp. V22 TaxID=2822139 RepID=UPI0024A9B20D|nr:GNAT family N-acetyltransferase [Pelomonas sp. V22]MDI4631898.1 GNAT family N-acetyltransferase [Pelomonas sp. V22]